MKFYTCYSINLLRFIKSHGIYPIDKFVHKSSNRKGWVFIENYELSKVLTKFTQLKEEYFKSKGEIHNAN